MEKELKPCPFCGREAEMYTGRLFPQKNVAVANTEAEARGILENYKTIESVAKCYIYRKAIYRAGKGRIPGKWAVRVQMKAFIPRCTHDKCIARNSYMFHTEDEALKAWNVRRPI